MSDRGLRQLERAYQATTSPESLYKLNEYLVRHGLIKLPIVQEDIRNLEREQGWAALPVYRAALVSYYSDVIGPHPSPFDRVIDEADQLRRDRRNAFSVFLDCVGRWGIAAEDGEILRQIREYIDEHNVWTDSQGQLRHYDPHLKSRDITEILTWFKIRDNYEFDIDTSVWDLITASPLIDEIIISENSRQQSRLYSERNFAYWRQRPGIPYYGGIYPENPPDGGWRTSVPGYGNRQSAVSAAVSHVIRYILNAKYRGRLWHGRPLSRDIWPETVALCVTQRAVEELSQESLYSYERYDTVWFKRPWMYNFLFDFPDEREEVQS